MKKVLYLVALFLYVLMGIEGCLSNSYTEVSTYNEAMQRYLWHIVEKGMPFVKEFKIGKLGIMFREDL